MNYMYEPKYLGILNTHLIEEDPNLFYQILKQNNLLGNSIFVFLGNKKYDLGIKDNVAEDIYLFIHGYIERDWFGLLQREKTTHAIKMNSFFNKEEKTSYLKEKHKYYFDNLTNYQSALRYIENDMEEWKLDMKWNIIANNWHFVKDYLCSKNQKPRIVDRVKSLSFFSEWKDCFISVKMTDFIKQQIQELESESETPELSFEPEKPSIPKSIAMLYVSGFFDTDKIKKLSPADLYKTVAIIIGKNPDNSSDIRSIKGNINVLNPNSTENRLKYTSNNYIERFKKIIS